MRTHFNLFYDQSLTGEETVQRKKSNRTSVVRCARPQKPF